MLLELHESYVTFSLEITFDIIVHIKSEVKRFAFNNVMEKLIEVELYVRLKPEFGMDD